MDRAVNRPISLLGAIALFALSTNASHAQDRHRDRPWRDGPQRPPMVAPRSVDDGENGRRGFGPPPPNGSPAPYARGRMAPRPRGPNSLGADWREQQDEARQGVRGGNLAPLGRVIDGIARRSPGRQLDAGLEYDNGRMVYRVRWMTDRGRRIDYIVDAATGQILSGR